MCQVQRMCLMHTHQQTDRFSRLTAFVSRQTCSTHLECLAAACFWQLCTCARTEQTENMQMLFCILLLLFGLGFIKHIHMFCLIPRRRKTTQNWRRNSGVAGCSEGTLSVQNNRLFVQNQRLPLAKIVYRSFAVFFIHFLPLIRFESINENRSFRFFSLFVWF